MAPKYSYRYRQLKKQSASPGAPAPQMEKALKAVEKKRGLNENKAAALIRTRLAKGQSVKGVRRFPDPGRAPAAGRPGNGRRVPVGTGDQTIRGR